MSPIFCYIICSAISTTYNIRIEVGIMAFIRVQYLKYDDNNNIIGGIASLKQSVYIKGEKYHSKQVTIESLGKVLYLRDDMKFGIFNSPTRGIVSYNVETNAFEEISLDDERIKDKNIKVNKKVHTVFGDAYLLVEFLKISKFTDIFKNMFESDREYIKFVGHLSHGVLKDGSHITCNNFIQKSFLSYLIDDLQLGTLKSDSRFFKMLGDDNIKISYFKNYIKQMKEIYPDFGKSSYVDSTPLPNDIIDNPFNALCSHGLKGVSIQMRLVLILDQETGYPVWFEIIPGNVLDVNTLKTIKENVFVSLGIKIISYVLDAGYVSKEVIDTIHIGTKETLIARMPAKKGYPYKELYNEVKDLFSKGKYQFIRNNHTYFGIKKEKKVFNQPVYEYVYLDRFNAEKGFKNYLKEHLEEYQAMKNKDKDFRMVKDGYFVLISNIDDSPENILESYFNRTEIEKVFKTSKEYLNILPIQKWNESSIKGKILIDMIETTVVLMLRKKLNGVISVSEIIGSTQSLMCFKDFNGNVTCDTPNRNVKEIYKIMGVSIPASINLDTYYKSIIVR